MISLFLSNILQLLLFHYFVDHVLKRKQSRLYSIYILYALESLLLTYLNSQGIISYSLLLSYILNYLIIEYFYFGRTFYKMLYVSVVIATASVSEVLAINGLLVFGEANNSMNMSSVMFLVGMLSGKVIQYFILMIIIKFTKITGSIKMPRYFWCIFILPITTVFYIFNIRDYALSTPKNAIISFITYIGLLVANIVTFYLFTTVIKNLNIKYNITLAESKDQIMKMNYELLKKQFDSHYTFLHDTKNDLSKLIALSDSGKHKELAEFSYNLYKNIMKIISTTVYAPDTFNLVYDNLFDEINKNNINLKIQLLENDFSFLNIYDQMSLFTLSLKLAISNSLTCDSDDRLIIFKNIIKNKNMHIALTFMINEELKSGNLFNDLESLILKLEGIINVDTSSPTVFKIYITLPIQRCPHEINR